MEHQKPIVVLVHGAFADSSSWDGVLDALRSSPHETIAFANPLLDLASDASALVDLCAALDAPVLLVGHSYGGMVMTEAAPSIPAVRGLVYVGAFVPDTGESAALIASRYEGSTLGPTVESTPLRSGGTDLRIAQRAFPGQFAADVGPDTAHRMAVTQRPITAATLDTPLSVTDVAWKRLPSWSVYGSADRNIPVAAHRWMAGRAGFRGVDELDGASHALAVSQPEAVATTVLWALQDQEVAR